MQNQRTAHQLQTWTAEDYAIHAQTSAQTAQKYHQLIGQKASAIEVDLARVNQEIDFLKKEVRRLESNGDNRSTCLIWGAGSAIVTALVMSLLLVPFQSQPVYRSQSYSTIGGK